MMGYGNGYGYNMMSRGEFPWLTFLILVIIITVAVIAVYKVISSRRSNTHSTINGDSLEILKQRYARGEIDEDQYKRMRDSIEK